MDFSIMSEKTYGFEDLALQLRATNSMLAALMTRDSDVKQRDVVLMLKDTGLPAAEIAKIVGTSTNTVQVTISQDKARKTAGKKKTLKLEDKSK